MSYVVLARQLAFQQSKPDEPSVPVGEEEIVERGGFVPPYATSGLVSVLSASGLIVWTDMEDPGLRPPGTEPVAVRMPEHPTVLPSDPRGQSMTLSDVLSDQPVGSGLAGEDEPPFVTDDGTRVPDLPKNSDSKETWENYAQLPEIGLTQGEAEAMNKQELMAEVKQRYANATA
jgi:hypothetical protein